MGPGAYNCHPVNLTGYTRRHGAYGYCEHGAWIALVSGIHTPHHILLFLHIRMREDFPSVTHKVSEDIYSEPIYT